MYRLTADPEFVGEVDNRGASTKIDNRPVRGSQRFYRGQRPVAENFSSTASGPARSIPSAATHSSEK